jgi:hypothetical protein
MPFQSEKQRKYMHIHHPVIAERWEHEAESRGEPAVQQHPDRVSRRKYGSSR